MSRLTLSFVLLAAPAWATDTYPTAIKTHLGLAAEPPQSCALCHRNFVTAAGTVTTPFGTSMRAQGLVANSETSLNVALDALDAAMTDSDGDGVADITELRNVTDPNVVGASTDGGTGGGGGSGGGTGGGGEELPPLRYGCGANAVPGLTGLASAALVLALRRRRRG